MSARRFHRLSSRLIVALSLATYAGVGILGHGLHSWLPCAGGACDDQHASHGHPAASHGGCCCHDHGLANQSSQSSEIDGVTLTAPSGHDPDSCSLCALLAKINTGYAELLAADNCVEPVAYVTAGGEFRLPADLILLAAARGPPLA